MAVFRMLTAVPVVALLAAAVPPSAAAAEDLASEAREATLQARRSS